MATTIEGTPEIEIDESKFTKEIKVPKILSNADEIKMTTKDVKIPE